MTSHTSQLILQQAEILIRTRGYAAFSYADLAETLGVTKAAIHYYYPGKEDLVVALTEDYVCRFRAELAAIKAAPTSVGQRLRRYGDLFLAGFEKGMLPYCGALAAERAALPVRMHPQIEAFFQIHLAWLGDMLAEARGNGSFRSPLRNEQIALTLLSTLEGGSFVGWALDRKAVVLSAFEAVLQGYGL